MILLHAGSGSHEVQLLESSVPEAAWRIDRRQAVRLLEQRWEHEAARLLAEIPFELRNGTNGFNDEFELLYYRAPLAPYVALADSIDAPATKHHYGQIAKALEEVGHPIRFIAVELNRDEEASLPEVVDTPSLAIRSDAVERALRDAEHLIDGRGASSGVDRIHTAFHGYLKAVADSANITMPENVGLTQLFKALREQHPSFKMTGTRQGDVDKIVSSMAIIVDALNPVRNKASGAHPNAEVLGDTEAMLVINSVRTLLHYVNSKTFDH